MKYRKTGSFPLGQFEIGLKKRKTSFHQNRIFFQQWHNDSTMTLSECSNMDWALEELLFQEAQNQTDSQEPTDLPKKEDYIEALHQLLENNDEDNQISPLPPSLFPQHFEEEAAEEIPVLLPPEGYRDDGLSDHENEHEPKGIVGSMTVGTTCPGDRQGMSNALLLTLNTQSCLLRFKNAPNKPFFKDL